jgi:hypothetical protein
MYIGVPKGRAFPSSFPNDTLPSLMVVTNQQGLLQATESFLLRQSINPPSSHSSSSSAIWLFARYTNIMMMIKRILQIEMPHSHAFGARLH